MEQPIIIDKPSYNDECRTFQWRRPDGMGQLNPTEVLVNCEVLCAEKNTGRDTTAEMINEVAVYDQTQTRYRLKSGTAGTVYILRFRATTSNGQKLEDKAILKVI